MNFVLCFTSLLFVSFCCCVPVEQPKPAPTYTTKYDNINLDEILNSKRLILQYIKCINENQGCTAQGTELKKILPDALKTNCSKCNEKQRNGAIKVISTLEKKYPEEWKKILDKWDPDGKLMESFKKANPDIYKQVFN